MRSALHDLANTLSGIRGVLELSDPNQPLGRRDRLRLDAILAEGMNILERSRHLAMGSLAPMELEPGLDWRSALEASLNPLAVIFRCTFHLRHRSQDAPDQWPGEGLRSYVMAVTRHLLPYAQEASIELDFETRASEWIIRWSPVSLLPESLLPEIQGRNRDIASRWALAVGASLQASLSFDEGTQIVQARIPRLP